MAIPERRIDQETVDLLEGIPALEKTKKHTIELVIDRLTVPHLTRLPIVDLDGDAMNTRAISTPS